MDRRRVLAGLGAVGLSGVAGCLSTAGPAARSVNGSVRPETEPEGVPDALRCDESEAKRLSGGYEDGTVSWGDTEHFALRVDSLASEYGDTAVVTLTNTSSETRETGVRSKFNFERATADGWRDVRVWDGGAALPYPGVAVSHAPGEGFAWTLELTEGGIVRATEFDEGEISVCPPLESGRYRFVFWGLTGDGAIAIAFDLRRET